jgi:arsenate reductase
MAEAYLRSRASDKYEVFSAGTEPSQVNPYAITVMEEIGIDISHHKAKNATEFLEMKLDLVVTVCDNANENCPIFPGGRKFIHKGFPDPKHVLGKENEKLKAFQNVRDEIISWIDSEFL